MSFMEAVSQQPFWLQVWINWLGAINVVAIVFVWRGVEARWVLGAFAASFLLMTWLHEVQGYTRLLGLPHVLFWTPLLTYLLRRLPRIELGSAYGLWLRVLFVTNGLSLLVDYVDVIRWIAGERSSLA